MPTPTGRPKVGEILLHRSTGTRAVVLERTSGTCYSVRVRVLTGRNAGREQWLTEFDWWLDRGTWAIDTAGGAH
jgi:hypothetical protein